MTATILLILSLFLSYVAIKGTVNMFMVKGYDNKLIENIHVLFVILTCVSWGLFYHYS